MVANKNPRTTVMQQAQKATAQIGARDQKAPESISQKRGMSRKADIFNRVKEGLLTLLANMGLNVC